MASILHTSTIAHSGQRPQQEARVLRTWVLVSYNAKFLTGTYHSSPLPLISRSLTLLNLDPVRTTSHESMSAQAAVGRIQQGHKQRHVDGCYEIHDEYSIIVRERLSYDSR